MLPLADLLMIGGAAFFAALVGGVTGYGTGLLLPPVLVPLIWAEAVVPVIGLSALFTNASRVAANRPDLDPELLRRIAPVALPATLLGAYGFTLLSGRGAAMLIGVMLILMVPLRTLARRRGLVLSGRGLTAASAGYGVVNGGTSGSGVLLLTLLMAAGLTGPQVIATDAAISFLLGLGKSAMFAARGALDLRLAGLALVIGLTAIPATFLAKRLSYRLPGHWHLRVLDGAVLLGGLLLIFRAG
ncbi:sulfite exporter TauE/SafE family protein [Frigidibacter sp. RF13]|uniref:sulfite exporter TauE/SafE family protein n=1 Tax=Frigidibacter sp. RF13 TaxID=2997340 RepID=UPI00226E8E0D|nr:sulfite exporter TauE/SafE family protein [Frigidibacter sp. RF13]MCY1127231.1 sulfite exporter TauE/SafE family protein [Frigidibacter sp. RF13]